MAHELESMFSVKVTPWHKLGVILPEAPTTADAIKHAGLDWKVDKLPLVTQDGQAVPEVFAIRRDKDKSILGTCGTSYQPLQNSDAFKFFDPFLELGEASLETAGSLQDGRKVWILAKIKRDPIEVIKGDTVEKFILLANTHDQGIAVSAGLTPIRVVCANTLAMAKKNAASRLVKVNHSSKMGMRLEEVQASIAEADAAFTRQAEAYKRFARKALTGPIVTNYLNSVFEWTPDKESDREKIFRERQLETIHRLFETGKGADIKGVKGTLWGLYNSVTEYLNYDRGREETRLDQLWFGQAKILNQRAFEEAVRVAA